MLATQISRFCPKATKKTCYKCSWLISNKHGSASELQCRQEIKTSYKNPVENKTPLKDLQVADCKKLSHPSSDKK